MIEFRPEDYKIPVIQGINDMPLAPNHQGNGKGCNGSYYIEKFNALVDFVTRYWERAVISSFDMNLGINQREVFVGERLLDMAQVGLPAPSLEFSYDVSGVPSDSVTARLYSGTSLSSLEPMSENILPGETFSYIPPNYNLEPNVYLHPTTRFWQIQGEINGTFAIKSEIISASWALPIIIGKTERSSGVVNTDVDFTVLHTARDLGLYVDIDFVEADKYLYVFSPRRLDGILLDDILVLTVETQQNARIYLEASDSFIEYPYWVYRTTTQGFGGVRVSLPKY